MASEKQTAANRRNAAKSTGPRSGPGKKRASRNAHSHGLNLSPAGPVFMAQVEGLARQIAGGSKDEIILEHARSAAHAELELERVRRVKVAFIERASALGTLDPPPALGSVRDLIRMAKLLERGEMPRMPERVDPLATMPSQEPERSAEAVRRVLPDLLKLDRYESRAITRRDRAVRELAKRSKDPNCR